MSGYFGWVFCVFFCLTASVSLKARNGDTGPVDAGDSRILFWASHITSMERGHRQAGRPDSGLVSAGSPEAAMGPATENGVVSLGDGGWICLEFPGLVRNGPGPDFAVFENGFSDSFLELAFAEVSSDGKTFVRFPAVSLTQTTEQTGPFGLLDGSLLRNLAGSYRAGLGTPFDLSDLEGRPGIDLQAIRYIRIRDVVGSLDPALGSPDSRGVLVNDPFPTPFPSGGFDLDAVGVLNGSEPGPFAIPGLLRPSVFDPGTEIGFFDLSGRELLRMPAGASEDMPAPVWFPRVWIVRGLYRGRWYSKVFGRV